MIRLTKQQVLLLHEQLIRETGGSSGIREESLLEAALEAPFQTYDDQDLFPSIQAKAARLGYGLIKNHAMVDGNKRLGVHVMLVFLALNGIELRYSQKELYEEILDVASGKSGYESLLKWVLLHQE